MYYFWRKRWFIWAIYAVATIAISAQRISLTTPGQATAYENYVIFRNAFRHVSQGLNPYAEYPLEQWDLYKYSPSFALLMAPFNTMPDWLGLSIWNLINALTLLAAIFALPLRDEKQRVFFAWFILPELAVSLQNCQSNGLIAAMLLWAYTALERSRPLGAAAMIASATFIKIFGLFAAPLALLYPRLGKFTARILLCSLILAAFPLVLLGPDYLIQLYRWWWELLQQDHAISVGLSVQGWLESWFGWLPDKTGITLIGILLLGLSVWQTARFNHAGQRALCWASVLIWVVIFNHRAESPTFVIALCGVLLWYLTGERHKWETALLWVIFVFASITPTDLFPRTLLNAWVKPYVLKAVPCIILWGIITFKLLRGPKNWTFESEVLPE